MRNGYTLIEVLMAMVLILVGTAGGYMAVVQSLRYMSVSRDVRHALIDAQGLLEEIQAMPPTDLFDYFPDHAEVTAATLAAEGGQPLAGERMILEYRAGRVESVLSAGPNTVQFSYAGPQGGSYEVSDVVLRIIYDASIDEFSGTGAGEVNENAGLTINFMVSGTLATAERAVLRVTLEGVDGRREVDIFVNGRGPYAPGPEFFGGGEVRGDIFLPDLQPLRMAVRNEWTTRGYALDRELTGARIW